MTRIDFSEVAEAGQKSFEEIIRSISRKPVSGQCSAKRILASAKATATQRRWDADARFSTLLFQL
jgi:hypothetical protein